MNCERNMNEQKEKRLVNLDNLSENGTRTKFETVRERRGNNLLWEQS